MNLHPSLYWFYESHLSQFAAQRESELNTQGTRIPLAANGCGEVRGVDVQFGGQVDATASLDLFKRSLCSQQ